MNAGAPCFGVELLPRRPQKMGGEPVGSATRNRGLSMLSGANPQLNQRQSQAGHGLAHVQQVDPMEAVLRCWERPGDIDAVTASAKAGYQQPFTVGGAAPGSFL